MAYSLERFIQIHAQPPPSRNNMFKSIIVLATIIACAFGKPSGLIAPVAYSAPIVTAASSQVVARNYNGIAAAPVAYAAPYAAAPYAAAPYAAAPFAYSAPVAYSAPAYAAAASPFAYSAPAYAAAPAPLAYSAPLSYAARYATGFAPAAYAAAAPALW